MRVTISAKILPDRIEVTISIGKKKAINMVRRLAAMAIIRAAVNPN